MTNCNYTQMTNQELVEYIDGINKTKQQLIPYIKNHQFELYSEILKRTEFLDNCFYQKENVPLRARIYCLRNNITSHPICQNPNCPNHNFVEWRFDKVGFAKYCSLKCTQTDDMVKQHKRITCQLHFGVDSHFQSNKIKEKIKQTVKNKYHADHIMHVESIKDKIKQTNLKKRGVEWVFQDNEIKQKIKRTCLEKHGVENGGASEQGKKKYIETCRNRYGVDSAFQVKSIQDKMKITMRQRYGVDNIMLIDEIKNGLLQRYKEEMMRKYGVNHYSQTHEFHQKCHKKYVNQKYPDMTFGSSWEFKVYDFLKEHNIEFEYQPAIVFEYEYDSRIWTYHPDFKIGNNIYEVKGEQFFRINESTGKEEMYCPWGRKKLGEEKWKWLCGKFEAKHQCMLKNNIIILRYNDIENLSGYINTPLKPIPPQQGM